MDVAGAAKGGRLFCLDALRGLDMAFLAWVNGLAVAVLGCFEGSPAWLREQFSHPPWGGFTAHDQIMPCFIFMCGAAVPLALGRFVAGGRPTRGFFVHVARRFAMLWVLGMFVGGALTSLDVMQIKPYSNTLQAIAAGYVVAALVFLVRARWLRFAIPFALALLYTALLCRFGDMTPAGNFANKVEMWCVGALGFPEGAKAYATGNYTWFLTTLMFGAMTVWGMNCTEIVRSGLPKWRKAGALFAFSALLTAVGWVSQAWVPCVKQIYTISFTCRSMGLCVALLAALYVVTDIWRLRRGWWLFTLFGQFSLTAYLACNAFRGVTSAFVLRFLEPGVKEMVSPEVFRVFVSLGMGVAITLVLVLRRRLKAACAKGRDLVQFAS